MKCTKSPVRNRRALSEAGANNLNAAKNFERAHEALEHGHFAKAQKWMEEYRKEVVYEDFDIHDGRTQKSYRLSAVIVAYNTGIELVRCIKSVLNSGKDWVEIIVVDNGGNEEVLDALLSLPVLYVKTPQNFLPSEGRNIGVHFATTPFCAFVDDDGVVSPDYCEQVLHALSHQEVCAVRGKVLPKTPNAYKNGAAHYDLGDKPFPGVIDVEGNSAWKRETFLGLGGMDPLMFGHEGIELTLRLFGRSGTEQAYYWPSMVLYHDFAVTPSKYCLKEGRHEKMDRYIAWKHGPRRMSAEEHHILCLIRGMQNPAGTSTLMPSEAFEGGQILWLTRTLGCGGVERQLVNCAKAFWKDGIKDIRLLCDTLDPLGGHDFFLPQVKSHFCGIDLTSGLHDSIVKEYSSRLEKLPFSLDWMPDWMREEFLLYLFWMFHLKPRLVHLWNGDFPVKALAACVAGVPRVIVSGQSMSPDQRAPYGVESPDPMLAYICYKLMEPFESLILTHNSTAGVDDCARWLGVSRSSIHLTPNAVEFPHVQPEVAKAVREALPIPVNGSILGGAFRFTAIKDPFLWVRAAAEVVLARNNTYAVLWGDGPLHKPCIELVKKLGLEDKIILPGKTDSCLEALSLCDVFMLTSLVEGLPNAVLEAHAIGKPVVTTAAGGVRDAVIDGRTGWVIGKRDPARLAEKVKEILDDYEFSKQASIIASHHIRKNFSLTKSLMPVKDIYGDLLRNNKKNCPENIQVSGPLVSVVMPVFNAELYIEDAVNSILCQSLENFEFLITDDCSEDQSWDILKQIKDPRIQLFRNTKRQGIAHNLNMMIGKSKGTYIARMDADDISFPQRFETQVAFMQNNPEIWACGGQHTAFGANSPENVRILETDPEGIRSAMIFDNQLAHPFMMLDGQKWRGLELKYDRQAIGAEDYELWMRLLATRPGVCFGNVPTVIGRYRVHPQSVTQKDPFQSKNTLLKALIEFFRPLGVSSFDRGLLLHTRFLFYPEMPLENREECAQLFLWADRLEELVKKNKNMDSHRVRHHLKKKLQNLCRNNAKFIDTLAPLYHQWDACH